MSKATLLAGAAAVNYVTYSCWTLLNKWQFSHAGTDCPLLSTSLQMLIAGAIACAVSVWRTGRVVALPDRPSNSADAGAWSPLWTLVATQIAPLGVSRAIDIGCGNVALSLVSVALQQILKSLLPLFVSLLSVFVLGRAVGGSVWIALVPVVAGSLLAAAPAPHEGHEHGGGTTAAAGGAVVAAGAGLGVALALASTFGRSLKAVLNAKLLAGSPGSAPLAPLEVLALEAPTSGAILLLCSALAAAVALFAAPQPNARLGTHHAPATTTHGATICSADAGTFVGVTLATGALMFFNQLSYISVIKLSSALTCQVLMNVKMLLLIGVSVAIFNTPLRALNVAGMGLAFAGCLLYARASAHELAAARKREFDGRAV
jgi:drug/metabolite transporter (DMT)-like permease